MIDEVWRCEKTFCCCVVVGGFPPPLFHPRPSPAMQLSSPPHHAVQRRSRAALGERPHAVVQCVYQWRVLMACTNGGCTNGCTADGGVRIWYTVSPPTFSSFSCTVVRPRAGGYREHTRCVCHRHDEGPQTACTPPRGHADRSRVMLANNTVVFFGVSPPFSRKRLGSLDKRQNGPLGALFGAKSKEIIKKRTRWSEII